MVTGRDVSCCLRVWSESIVKQRMLRRPRSVMSNNVKTLDPRSAVNLVQCRGRLDRSTHFDRLLLLHGR